MSLRENTVFFRCSTYEDLLDDARLLDIIEAIQTRLQLPFTTFQDLGAAPRQRPRRPQPLNDHLERVIAQGVHLAARFALTAESAPKLRLEIAAGLHPYTGNYRTALDLRVDQAHFAQPAYTRRFVALIDHIATRIQPFVGHAHSSDDNSIQNIANAGLLERGFGITTTEPIDVRTRPGREVNRGELRYAINWINLFGPTFVEQLGAERFQELPGGTLQSLPGGTLRLRLYDTPLEADMPEHREFQRALWEHLDFERHVRETSYNFGYWDSKSR